MGRIYQRDQAWYIDYSFNGRRVRKSVGTSKKMAELALKDVELRIAKGEFLGVSEDRRMTFDELVAEYLKFSKTNKRPQVYRRDQIITRNLSKAFHGFGIADISAHDLEQYKAKRVNEISASTVNRELTCVKHMFNKAVEWRFLRHNPLQTVKRFKEPPGRLRYLTESEIERLLNECAVHLKPVVVVALYTGLRKSEILNLTWADVDMQNRVITVNESKNNESRILPFHETVYKTLRSLQNGSGKGQAVFTDKNGLPLGNFRRSFETAVRRTGIENFKFHDLRHTFASRLVMAGVDIRTVQQLMGHKDIRMTMRYSHLSDDHLKEAVKKLENGTNLAQ